MAEAENLREKLNVEPKSLTYLCRFDEQGRRGETHLSCDYTEEQKAEMLKNGFVEISQEDWDYYVGNKGMGDNGTGYIRDSKTGKPVSAPAHVPSKAEKLMSLEAQYEADKKALKDYLMDAIIADDTEAVEDIKAEMAEVEADYLEKREELEE